jgi:hypothetical protein
MRLARLTLELSELAVHLVKRAQQLQSGETPALARNGSARGPLASPCVESQDQGEDADHPTGYLEESDRL